jgi:MFS transporter, DHA2 family, multidrug resistance protein
MGVSLSQTVLARREQFHQERLSENVGSWNPFYYDTLNQIEAYFRTHTFIGSSSGTSVAYVGQMVQSQAAILAYIDVFFALAVVAGIMSLSLRSVTRGARAFSCASHGPSHVIFHGTLSCQIPHAVRCVPR